MKMKYGGILALFSSHFVVATFANIMYIKERCLQPKVLKETKCSVISPGVDFPARKISPCFCTKKACSHFSIEAAKKHCASGYVHAARYHKNIDY